MPARSSAQANAAQRAAMTKFGSVIGQAFQIADDHSRRRERRRDTRQGRRQGCRRRQGDAGQRVRDCESEGAIARTRRRSRTGARAVRREGGGAEGSRAFRRGPEVVSQPAHHTSTRRLSRFITIPVANGLVIRKTSACATSSGWPMRRAGNVSEAFLYIASRAAADI